MADAAEPGTVPVPDERGAALTQADLVRWSEALAGIARTGLGFSENTFERGPAGDSTNQPAALNMPKLFVCPSAHRVKPASQFKDYGVNHGTGACCPERTQVGMDGVAFVNRLVPGAEAADHHPDILINYKRVTLTYSTHSEGGLTAKDFEGAAIADAHVAA